MFAAQDPYVDPFREIDGRVGYYANGEWRYGEKLLLRVGLYDNRADPTTLKDGQYAWYTEFLHVGLQTTLPGDVGLIAQWMSGSTVMGPVMYTNGAHAVDAEFDSHFALLSRAYGRHRLSVRYDNFEVTQNDQTPADDNRESGHAVTVSWQLGVTDKVSVVAESVTIKSRRDIWMSFGLEPDETETQFQLSLRLRL
jgi:hypothetical protein